MKRATFEGKDRMLFDWSRVMIAIIRANSGSSNFEYKRDDEGNVIGLTAEIQVQLENGVSDKDFANYDKAIEEAKRQMADTITEEGEFTSKQRLLIDWVSMRNAIVRAYTGEMKVDIGRNHFGKLPVGLIAELDLDFVGPTEPVFTDEEKSHIDEVKSEDN